MVNVIKEEKRSKNKMKTKKLLVVFFGVLLLAIGPIMIAYGLSLADNETKAMKGELLPFEIDSQKLIEIQIGGIHVMTDMNSLREGFNLLIWALIILFK
jgi:hypothetical protein